MSGRKSTFWDRVKRLFGSRSPGETESLAQLEEALGQLDPEQRAKVERDLEAVKRAEKRKEE